MSSDELYFSVVMPAHQAERMLPQSLESLLASDFPRHRWELIVVDDASTDRTGAIAARFADTIVRLPDRAQGPAYARNRGFEVSRGRNILFVDADVCVHGDTLSLFASKLDAAADIGAFFGSYDARPPAPGIVSQYRNLLHHFVHQNNGGDVDSFWAGCGAVRRDVFADAGMYDEWNFARPQIEDIELGHRIRAHGHRIVLCPDILCTHLKRWTLGEAVRTDIRDRGIPWARLRAQGGPDPATATLNLKRTERLNTALVWLALVGVLVGTWSRSPTILVGSLLLLVPVMILSLPLFRLFVRERGVPFAMAVVPLHIVHYVLTGISAALGLVLHETFGAPMPDPTIDAYAEVGVKRWPPIPAKRAPSSSPRIPETKE